jgi:hypothetical protein
VNVYQVLGGAIADSVKSVGTAFRLFSDSDTAAGQLDGWLEQFSPSSLDQRRARRTVAALYRGATVRL